MSTNAAVAVVLPDGKVKSITVHFDGYLDDLGNTLYKYYNQFDKVIELIDRGSASFIEKNLDQSYFYHIPCDVYSDIKTFLEDCEDDPCIEFVYFFQNNEWMVKAYSTVERLKTALGEDEIKEDELS